jgi:hypothetical protein
MRRGPTSAEDTTGEGHEVKKPGRKVEAFPGRACDTASGNLPGRS